MTGRSVFVNIVTYNNSTSILKCLEGLLKQENFDIGLNLIVHIRDNASSDTTAELLDTISTSGISIHKNKENLGFCTAHNIAFREFINSDKEYFLCLNPDLYLEKNAISNLVAAVESAPEIGSACPKLLRADTDLKPIVPAVIDAAGMYLTSGLRHFDRGSNCPDAKDYSNKVYVFGGSGACLLMKREYILDVAISQPDYINDLKQVYPQLKSVTAEKLEVFDEAFFAYREDADLAWRSQLLGWNCLYVPESVGYHIRKVTPQKRSQLSQDINLLGVKNRFLLQLNNYSLSYGIKTFIAGYFFRNMFVVLAVILKERSSMPAFFQIFKLLKRSLQRRKILNERMRKSHAEVSEWIDRKIKEYK